MQNLSEIQKFLTKVTRNSIFTSIKKIPKYEKEIFNRDMDVIQSIHELPNELQFEILLLCNDYQLQRLEHDFREIIHSNYFIKKRVSSKMVLIEHNLGYERPSLLEPYRSRSIVRIDPRTGDLSTELIIHATLDIIPEQLEGRQARYTAAAADSAA